MLKPKYLSLVALLMPTALAAQEISAPSTTINCGSVAFGQPMTAQFHLRNSGSQPLVISDVRTECGCTTASWPRTPIKPDETFDISVVYDAKTMGHFNKRVAVESNAPEVVLSVKGTVEGPKDYSGDYPFNLGGLRADRNDIEFDDVSTVEQPIAEINIINDSSAIAEPTVMHLPAWLKASVTPRRIAPGHKGKVQIQFDPLKVDTFGLVQTDLYLGMFPGDNVAPEKAVDVKAIVLPDFSTLTQVQLDRAPKMRLSAASLDLGTFDGKAKKGGTITITNQGASPLIIRRLQMFTAGLEVSLNKSQLMPGEKAKLKITAIAQLLAGIHSKPRVLLITNDPENTKVIINVNIDGH